MTDMDQRLVALAGDVAWPPTPALDARVRAALATAPAPAPARARGRWWRRPPLLLAALVAATSAAGAGAAVLFSLDGARVERRDSPPPAAPATRGLDLGPAAGYADAPFAPVAPARAGEPQAIHLRDGIELSLAYGPAPGRPRAAQTDLGLLVTEFRGDLHPDYLTKVAYQGTSVRRLRIDGRRALWVAGAPHFFFYRTRRGLIDDRPLRLAANVLLLEHGRLLVRLEGAFELEEAVALARSLRPVGPRGGS